MGDLLPCPFCGTQPITGHDDCGYVQLLCGLSHCLNPATPYCEEEYMAEEIWNTRAPSEKLTAAENALREVGLGLLLIKGELEFMNQKQLASGCDFQLTKIKQILGEA